MKELIENVVQWGVVRGLDKVGHLAQAKYTLKETAELLDAYADQDIEKINDAIGDILVTLIVGASNDKNAIFMFKNEILNSNPQFSCNTLTSRSINNLVMQVTSLMFNKTFLAHEYWLCSHSLNRMLHVVNREFNQALSLKDCLQLAYDEIKDRTGKLVDGQFIKD